MINAGDFNRRITIVRRTKTTNNNGFDTFTETEVCKAWAKVNTTKGYTLVASGSNFEDATTGLVIRQPRVAIDRKDIVKFASKEWRIRYLNVIDEANKFVELQVEEVTQ